MNAVNKVDTTGSAGAKFPTACPSCQMDLNGYLIRQLLLSPEECRDMLRGRASERTIRGWIREWCPSGQLPGRRAPVVVARDFVLALEAHKVPCGGKRAAPPRRAAPLQTKCSDCGAAWGGFVAGLAFRGMGDVLPEIGAGFVADAVTRWIRSGLLRAFRIQGIRGPLFDMREFTEDFAAMRAKYMSLRNLRPVTEATTKTTAENAK